MKRLITFFVLCSLFSFDLSAQNARLHFKLSHSRATAVEIFILRKALDQDFFKKGGSSIPLDKQASASYTVSLRTPESILFYVNDPNTTQEPLGGSIYLSPGDDLYLSIDPDGRDNKISVTGKGSGNNPPGMITWRSETDLHAFSGDTLPHRVMAAISNQKHANDSMVNTYIQNHHLSADRVRNLRDECAYYPPMAYFRFMENNKYGIRAAYARNFTRWKAVRDSLFSTIRLNNDSALTAYNYISLIRTFLSREKERLKMESATPPEEDHANIPGENIIERNFNGRSAQYLYAVQFESAFRDGNPQNIVSIFERFTKKYPNSEYIPWIKPYIDTVKMRQSQTLTDKMIFPPGNGLQLDSFSNILSMARGKTVLLDMWGTWCVPCRQELQLHSKAIKAHFAGRGLEYFYVDNFDQPNEKLWRQLIAYLHLEGTHILANSNLTNDIMAKIQRNEYPTYIIIKKDGSYELSKAGYPMDRDKLIQQLETALAL